MAEVIIGSGFGEGWQLSDDVFVGLLDGGLRFLLFRHFVGVKPVLDDLHLVVVSLTNDALRRLHYSNKLLNKVIAMIKIGESVLVLVGRLGVVAEGRTSVGRVVCSLFAFSLAVEVLVVAVDLLKLVLFDLYAFVYRTQVCLKAFNQLHLLLFI